MKRIIALLLLFALIKVNAQDNERRPITTAVPFLTIPVDSRASGMGDIGVATSPDVFSQQYNPAKYAFASNQIGIGLSYTPYLSRIIDDIDIGELNFYNRFDERSAFSARFKIFSLGEIQLTDATGLSLGVEAPLEMALDVAYSLKLSERFSMGVGGRFIFSDLKLQVLDEDSSSASSFAVDIGGYYQSEEIAYPDFNGRWRGGFSITNLGPKLSYDSGGREFYLPTMLRLGGGFDFLFPGGLNKLAVNTEVTKLLVPSPVGVDTNGDGTIDSVQQPDKSFLSGVFSSFGDADGGFSEELEEFTWALGAEYTYDDAFAFRAGYFNESENKGGRKFFNLGAGFRYNVMNLDVSYLFSASQVRNPLESTLRFSLTFNLGETYIDY